MKKHFYLATLLAVAVMFMACNNDEPSDNGGSTTKAKQGEWITSASQVDLSLFDDQETKCWQIDTWCDGTTIGVQYEWTTEAAVALTAKNILAIDYQHFQRQTKKVLFKESDPTDEMSCTSQTWPNAECWEETISYNGGQSETNYGWMPEANMLERHDYYASKGLTHTFVRANAADPSACEALNPQNQGGEGGEGGQGGGSTIDYSQYDNTVEKCWTATITIVGQDMVRYIWGTERFARETMDATQQTYTLAPSSATDENACDALNN